MALVQRHIRAPPEERAELNALVDLLNEQNWRLFDEVSCLAMTGSLILRG
jgi:hypothetical protein